MNRYLKGVDPAVFWGSAALIGALVGWGLLAPASLGARMTSTLGWIIGNFGWGFVLVAFGGLVLCIFLVVSRFGAIRLGPDDSRPAFGTFSWVSMMFAAGLGAGLLFYGTADRVRRRTRPDHRRAGRDQLERHPHRAVGPVRPPDDPLRGLSTIRLRSRSGPKA